MNLLKTIVALGCALILSGCATTPLNPATDLPHGYYTGKIGTQPNLGNFQVRAPQPLRNAPPEILTLNRQTGSDYTQVNIGPTFADPCAFSVRVELKSANNMTHTLMSNQSRNMHMLAQKKVVVNGHPATYLVFASPGHDETSTSGNVTNVNITPSSTDGIYFVDYGKYNVIFWITAGNFDASQNSAAALQRQMINGTWGPAVEFVNSFKLSQ